MIEDILQDKNMNPRDKELKIKQLLNSVAKDKKLFGMLTNYYENKTEFMYASDSDDSAKYMTEKNKNFKRLTTNSKVKWVLRLWRACFVRAFCAAVIIS